MLEIEPIGQRGRSATESGQNGKVISKSCVEFGDRILYYCFTCNHTIPIWRS